jgi:hypothetical protein
MTVLCHLAGVLNPTKKTVLNTKVSPSMKISLSKHFLPEINEIESSHQLLCKGICGLFLIPPHLKLNKDNTSFFFSQ